MSCANWTNTAELKQTGWTYWNSVHPRLLHVRDDWWSEHQPRCRMLWKCGRYDDAYGRFYLSVSVLVFSLTGIISNSSSGNVFHVCVILHIIYYSIIAGVGNIRSWISVVIHVMENRKQLHAAVQWLTVMMSELIFRNWAEEAADAVESWHLVSVKVCVCVLCDRVNRSCSEVILWLRGRWSKSPKNTFLLLKSIKSPDA